MALRLACAVLTFSVVVSGAAPTITLGPDSDYAIAPAETAAPTGSELVVTPSDLRKGIPAQGIDVFLGPDLRNTLAGALAGACAKGFDQGCVDIVTKQINIGPASLSRSPGFAVNAVIVAIPVVLAWLAQKELERTKDHQKLDIHYHIPASDVSQMQSQTVDSIVLETATRSFLTITPTTSPTPAPTPATATVLTADGQGHHKGDLVLSLPTQAADLLKQLINQNGQCSSSRNRSRLRLRGKGPDMSVVTNVAIWVLPNAAPHQLLNGFDIQAIPQQLLHYRDATVQQALESVQAVALKLPEYAGVTVEITKSVASYVFVAAYGICIDHAGELEQLAIDSSLVSEDPTGDDDQNVKKCATDITEAPLCSDENCVGLNGSCQQGEKKGCTCLQTAKVFFQRGTRQDWDSAQKIIKTLIEGGNPGTEKDQPGKLVCDTEKRVNLEDSDFNKLAAAFCKDIDLSKESGTAITPTEAGTRGPYPGYQFIFQWKPTTVGCVNYDSHTFAASGSQNLACGVASFRFNDGKSDSTDDLTCRQYTDMGNPNHYVSLDTMNQAADAFCQRQADQKTTFEPQKVAPNTFWHYNDNRNDPVYVMAGWNDALKCDAFDFSSSSGIETCKDRLKFVINTCDTSNPGGLHYWKSGGQYQRDCIMWYIFRDTFDNQPSDDKPTTEDSWRPKS